MNPTNQHSLVQSQFGSTAAAYATSVTHANADDLARCVALVAPQLGDIALDIATGAGNVALALVPFVKSVVATDITTSMLETTAQRAAEGSFVNLTTKYSEAENLDFPDSTFDIVTVRTAPHHFADIRKAVHEMARVLKPGGRVLVVDTCSPEDPLLDADLNAIEVLRDPSHVRNYSATEWREFMAEAGLEIVSLEVSNWSLGKKLVLQDWMDRMHCDADTQAKLRDMFVNARPGLKELLQVTDEEPISFRLPEITILARK